LTDLPSIRPLGNGAVDEGDQDLRRKRFKGTSQLIGNTEGFQDDAAQLLKNRRFGAS
jgi:hypothetical protein